MSDIPRLRWLCRRGMKELDVVMTGYLENQYPVACARDQQAFKTLLEMPDPDIFSLLTGKTTVADEGISNLIDWLKKSVPVST